MLLRRITKHVKTQNWFAVAIDFVIVVLGVFMGIQLGNWNDARQDKQNEKGYLIRLHEDFSASIAGLSSDNDVLRSQLEQAKVILDSLDACDVQEDKEDVFQRGLNTLNWINPARFYSRTIDELVATGDLRTIRSVTIQEKLQEILTAVEWRNAVSGSVLRIADEHRLIIEQNLRFDLSQQLGNNMYRVVYDIEELCRNPAIASSVSSLAKVKFERLGGHDTLLDQYREFLPLIENELEARWNDPVGASDQ